MDTYGMIYMSVPVRSLFKAVSCYYVILKISENYLFTERNVLFTHSTFGSGIHQEIFTVVVCVHYFIAMQPRDRHGTIL